MGRGTLTDLSASALAKVEPGVWVLGNSASPVPAGLKSLWGLMLVMREGAITWAIVLPTEQGNAYTLRSSAGVTEWFRFPLALDSQTN